jgi:hypothetical protein
MSAVLPPEVWHRIVWSVEGIGVWDTVSRLCWDTREAVGIPSKRKVLEEELFQCLPFRLYKALAGSLISDYDSLVDIVPRYSTLSFILGLMGRYKQYNTADFSKIINSYENQLVLSGRMGLCLVLRHMPFFQHHRRNFHPSEENNE